MQNDLEVNVTTHAEKIAHLKWSIEKRFDNQKSAIKLLELLVLYEKRWKSKKYSVAAQNLLGVSFSLWRAAFLANKSGKRTEVYKHGLSFLEKVIEDNAISYPTDKGSNEWTFNFYTLAAKHSLQALNRKWPKIVPEYVGKTRAPMERWQYCQESLDVAIDGFKQHFEVEIESRRIAKAKKGRRATRKAQRKTVRALVLNEKKATSPRD
ncbi:MAG: hypothetical protein ACRETM_13325 [Stenotrophobium sp.]